MRHKLDIGQRSGPSPRRVRALAGVVATGFLVAACGSSGSSTSATTAQKSTSATTATTSPTPMSTTTTATSATGRFIPATTPVYEFYSPSRNISCEIDYSSGTAATQSVLCETISPTQSVVMSADGTLRTCYGMQCGSNAGVNTPTLAYGDSTGAGPFKCASTVAAMVCTVTTGKGFSISRAAITPING
jgi:hypothetical protein